MCSCPKHNQPRRQDHTGASSRMQGIDWDEKENEAVQLSTVHVRGEVSDSDDDLAFSIKEAKRPAVKRLPFSNSQVKRNTLVVMKSKGEIRKPRYDPISNQNQQRIITTGYAWTMHRIRVLCMVTCECGGMTRPHI